MGSIRLMDIVEKTDATKKEKLILVTNGDHKWGSSTSEKQDWTGKYGFQLDHEVDKATRLIIQKTVEGVVTSDVEG